MPYILVCSERLDLIKIIGIVRGRFGACADAVVALFLHPDAVFTSRQMAFKIAVDGGGFHLAQGAAVAVHLAFVRLLRVVYVKEFFHDLGEWLQLPVTFSGLWLSGCLCIRLDMWTRLLFCLP